MDKMSESLKDSQGQKDRKKHERKNGGVKTF